MLFHPDHRDSVNVALQRSGVPRDKVGKILTLLDSVVANFDKAEPEIDAIIAKHPAPSSERPKQTRPEPVVA